jgi:hypothetical protein
MKVRTGGIIVVVAAATLGLFSGCSSSSPAKSGAGGAGVGGAGMGGAIGMGGTTGTGGTGIADAGADRKDGGDRATSMTDGSVSTDGRVDAAAATLTQIWTMILSDVTPPDTAPTCVGCHDGTPGIPDYTSVAMTYATWVNVPSTSCPPGIRVTPGNAETSVLINKLRAKPNLGLGVTVCGGVAMPMGDTRSITLDQLHMIESWINAGALNN